MRSTRPTRPLALVRRRTLAAACALAAAVVSVGCGEEPRRNALRPPAPIVVSVAITDRGVALSPDEVGAGPVTLLIANRSGDAQRVTLSESAPPRNGPGRRAVATGPINPGETASVQAEVEQGTYTLSAGEGIEPGTLTVGRERPSSQNRLHMP